MNIALYLILLLPLVTLEVLVLEASHSPAPNILVLSLQCLIRTHRGLPTSSILLCLPPPPSPTATPILSHHQPPPHTSSPASTHKMKLDVLRFDSTNPLG